MWYRVIEPQSPLYGCDVRGNIICGVFDDDDGSGDGLLIKAVRRVDMVVGDRPWQMSAQTLTDLGIMVRFVHLDVSPVQEDVVELDRGSPYGQFVAENSYESYDSNYLMQVVRYERAIQVVLRENVYDDTGQRVAEMTLAKNTWVNADLEELIELESRLSNMLSDADPSNLANFIMTGGQSG